MSETSRLMILSEQLRGKSFNLVKERYTCGRKSERDICFKDPTVSSHHCDFVKTGNTFTIRDRESTNGTRVNNLPVTEQELHNTDIIQVGDIEILYESEDKSKKTVKKSGTGITLDSDDPGGITVKMDNVSPFANKKGRNIAAILIYTFVVLLVVAIIALLVFLGWKILTQEISQLKDSCSQTAFICKFEN